MKVINKNLVYLFLIILITITPLVFIKNSEFGGADGKAEEIITKLNPNYKEASDNLKKIKGINSKIENDLNTLGIYHFEQISNWSTKNCDWIEEFLHFRGVAKSNQWVDQAKILTSGKETLYSQKVQNGEIEVD